MPHLVEKMKRLTAKDESARRQTQFERAPDFDAISRIKPLPKDPTPPPPPVASQSSDMDQFLSSLSDEEAHFLARRRAQMLDRVAQLAATERDTPTLPTSGRNMDAYLAGLSDEEALFLARRREQELQVLQDKLRQLTQTRAQVTRAAAPAAPRVNASTGTSVTTLTDEEKLLLARHRAEKRSNGALANSNALAQERARWEKLKNDFNASSQSTRGVSQAEAAILARHRQGASALPNNNTYREISLRAALLARQAQSAVSLSNNLRQGTQSSPDLEAILLARSRQSQGVPTLPTNFCRGSGDPIPSELEALILERARRAKVQADFLATAATQNDYRRASTDSAASEDSEAAILARARQVQIQSELLSPPSSQNQVRRDSLAVVKAALETMRRAEMFNSVPQNQRLHQSTPTRESPGPMATSIGDMGNHSQPNPASNDSQNNIAAIRESLLRLREAKSEIGVAEFLAMKKGGRR